MIELIATLAVLSILLAVGVPSFIGTMKRNRIAAEQNDFRNTLTVARSEAIKRGRSVVVSGTSPSSGNEFGGGWRIWVDVNGNGAQDSGEPTLRAHESLDGNRLGSAQNTSNIVFLASGFLDTSGLPSVPLSYQLCDGGGGGRGVRFSIMASGLVSVNSDVACP